MVREARLLPAGAGLYPGVRTEEWRPAAVLVDQVLASLLLRGIDTALRGRALPEEHFEFRGGNTSGGQREGVRTPAGVT